MPILAIDALAGEIVAEGEGDDFGLLKLGEAIVEPGAGAFWR